MRHFLMICALSLALTTASAAQDLPTVTCPDGTSVDPLLSISLPSQAPATRDDLPEPYFVSVITEESKPTLAISDEAGLITCAPQDTLAETIQVTSGLDGITLGNTPYSAWVIASAETATTAVVGQMAGRSLLLIEGGHITREDDEGDVYTFTLNPALSDAFNGTTFQVDLLGVDDSYQPGLSLIDVEGTVIKEINDPAQQCTPLLCSIGIPGHISYQGLRVPVYQSKPTDQGMIINRVEESTFSVRVDSHDSEGHYTLAISFALTVTATETLSAQASQNADGTWTVQCDGNPAFENGVKLDMFTEQVEDIHPGLDLASITPETPLTLTALSPDTPVVMAVMTSDTEGYCVQQSADASSYAIALPDLDVPPTLNGAQVALTQAPQFVLVGSAQPTSVALVVEGWDAPTFEGDLHSYLHPLFQLNVTPSILDNGIRLYGIAADDSTNPAVGLLIPAASFILVCDNAAVPDECPPDSASLTGYTLTLAEGRVLPGANLDAMLRFNAMDAALDPVTSVDPVQIAANDQTGQGGPLVIVTAFTLSSPEQSPSQ